MVSMILCYISILSLHLHTAAATSASPRVLLESLNSLHIRQSSGGTCGSGLRCASGDCIPASYHCCSDGAGCPIGSDCVPNGCCPSGESCSGGGGGTMTFSEAIDIPTFTAPSLAETSFSAPSFTEPSFGVPSLTGLSYTTPTFGTDSYDSFLQSVYSGALRTASALERSRTADIPAALPTNARTGASAGSGQVASTRSPNAAPTGASGGSSSPPKSAPPSGAQRDVAGVSFAAFVSAGVILFLWRL